MTRAFSLIATGIVCSGLMAAATWIVSGDEPTSVETSRLVVGVTVASIPAPAQAEFGFSIETCVEDSAAFSVLVDQWRKGRGATSSTTETVLNEAYQRIIGMGPKAVPLVLAQMASEGEDPDQWFWALQMLTGVNPILEEDEGNFAVMAKSWFKWASDAGYVW